MEDAINNCRKWRTIIVRKFKNNVFVYMLLFLAFIASVWYGIHYGYIHPYIFFAMIMTVFVAIVLLFVTTHLKDVIILMLGMILLGIIGQLINDFLLVNLSKGIIKMILQCICMLPIFCPLACFFRKCFRKNQSIDDK